MQSDYEKPTKTVLVSFLEYKREVSFSSDELISTIKAKFKDVMRPGMNLILQLKNEEWQGEYVDVSNILDIPDKSILKAINPNESHVSI